jgi:hypothetical protein
MKIKYKILIFFLIHCWILNDSWAEVKIEKVVPPIIDNVTPVTPDIVDPSIIDNVTPVVPDPVSPPTTDIVTPVTPDIVSPPTTDNINSSITDNVTPVAPDNVNTSTADNAVDKTVIDSKINASMTGYAIDPELSKINSNNFAIGISLGKKFEANNLFNFSEKYSEYFENKFILAELFFNKNINKKSTKRKMEIDSLQGFRTGFGSNFKNINLMITSNIFYANLSPNPSKNNRNLLLLMGFSAGYKLNKKIDLRLNIISSFGQKIRAFNNNFNNFDLSMAINL